MQGLVLASGNRGKLRELSAMLEPLGIELLPQGDFDVVPMEETGTTFRENALLKARHAASASRLPALADDSGLEVDALDGAPGVRSARYAGPEADDRANNRKLLEALAGVPDHRRSARFRCVLALVDSPADPDPMVCEGVWEGRILTEPRGRGGFGYDPLFLVPELGLASAELDPEEKNRISHRARALEALRHALVQRGG